MKKEIIKFLNNQQIKKQDCIKQTINKFNKLSKFNHKDLRKPNWLKHSSHKNQKGFKVIFPIIK